MAPILMLLQHPNAIDPTATIKTILTLEALNIQMYPKWPKKQEKQK